MNAKKGKMIGGSMLRASRLTSDPHWHFFALIRGQTPAFLRVSAPPRFRFASLFRCPFALKPYTALPDRNNVPRRPDVGDGITLDEQQVGTHARLNQTAIFESEDAGRP